ncbi:hypothetical protein O6P43_012330 [Quillaja saponaria]|uniref:Uncharacterized protein n=1 Tax=Quillaja saponaria TaxID=32244 RepID=A0AAD7PVB0_QUISA|nr:hypothetical protein O6P43_012330 [Quillaja saponaria]
MKNVRYVCCSTRLHDSGCAVVADASLYNICIWSGKVQRTNNNYLLLPFAGVRLAIAIDDEYICDVG